MPNSDDEEEKENRKRKRIENLENARKVKKTKAAAEPCTKRNSKTSLLKESQVLCGEETQVLLNDLDNYLYTYHYGRSGSKIGEHSMTDADSFECSQQNLSDDDDATQYQVLHTICLPTTVLISSHSQSCNMLNLDCKYTCQYSYTVLLKIS